MYPVFVFVFVFVLSFVPVSFSVRNRSVRNISYLSFLSLLIFNCCNIKLGSGFVFKDINPFNFRFVKTNNRPLLHNSLVPSEKGKSRHSLRVKNVSSLSLSSSSLTSSLTSSNSTDEKTKVEENQQQKKENEQICFIAGIGDTNGYGWGIAKELSKKNVKLIFGIWPPVFSIFMRNYENGKFDKDMIIDENKKMNIVDIIPFDAAFDTYKDIDEETKKNKRYINFQNYSIEEAANLIHKKYGTIDMLVHSLANGKEVQNDLLNTSRYGYLDAISKSSYSLISMCKHFSKIMKPESSIISLTYQASQKVVPGYGGGMSSAKAALESDTRVLAYHLGRNYKIRINTISAGPLKSRAASAIKKVDVTNENEKNENVSFIDYAINYSEKYAPLKQTLYSTDVGAVAAFLLSKEARAVTGQTIYVDNGLNVMFGPDDLFQNANEQTDTQKTDTH